MGKNRHHYDPPKSRRKGQSKHGVCKVDEKIHHLSHLIFGNLFPWEILEFLNENLWDNSYDITIKKKGED